MSMGKRFLSREDVLAINDLQKEEVFVSEWDAWVWVRALTGTERDAFEASLVSEKTIRRGRKSETTREANLNNLRARLCALTMCDEEGNRLFSDADVRELGKKSASALNKVFEVAQRLSGLSDDDVEELAGNSPDDPNDDSTSD